MFEHGTLKNYKSPLTLTSVLDVFKFDKLRHFSTQYNLLGEMIMQRKII